LKDKDEGFGWVAVVKLEEVGEGPALLEGNDGKQGIARERQGESGLGSSMPVPVFLPGGGVAFVVVAVLDAPVLSFAAQVKKGEPSRARVAPFRRLEVFSFVPMR
jgi:hypothetical protein